MRLATKITIIIFFTVTTIISVLFFVLGAHLNRQIENHLLTSARMIYNNIVIVRNWVAERDGVFQLKFPGDKSNPFLVHPELISVDNDTLIMRNPALVTRELSELSYKMGKGFSFHLASLKYINPVNKPDAFEKAALNSFPNSGFSEADSEFYRTESINGEEYFRYFAPLITQKSCLGCHAEQGYKTGDIRGGISIMLKTEKHKSAKREHLFFFFLTGVVTVFALAVPIYYSIKRSVITPITSIESAAQKIRMGNYNFQLNENKTDEFGKLAHTFNLMSERIKESTRRLSTSEKKYRQLNEHSFDAAAIVDVEGIIIETNSKFNHLSGFNFNELKTQNIYELIYMEDKIDLPKKPDEFGQAEHFETKLNSREGIDIPVEIYIIKGFTLDDLENISFVYIRDLSERKKIEEHSLQTEKMFSLGQISAGIAHEIRNPIFALNNNLNYLKNNCPNNEPFKEVYPEFKESIQRIQKLVSSILDYAKPHELSFRDINIQTCIDNSVNLIKKQFEKSNCVIETHYDHRQQKISADTYKLEQVFVNLFINAMQAMEGNGVLRIATSIEGKHLRVKIEDNGKGIKAKDLNRIFDPFYTTSEQGTGLGMAIVQRILNQHNSHFWLKSEENFGTTFHILFHLVSEVKSDI
jgi:PAS domain S-box-containing protein